MVKLTWNNFIISTTLLFIVVLSLSYIDSKQPDNINTTNDTTLRVKVMDLSTGDGIHNAIVVVDGNSFYCDNKGYSPIITVSQRDNIYDQDITEWFTTNVIVSKSGYITTIVSQCVVSVNATRTININLLQQDSNSPPFISYVESPPDSYLQQLLDQYE